MASECNPINYSVLQFGFYFGFIPNGLAKKLIAAVH